MIINIFNQQFMKTSLGVDYVVVSDVSNTTSTNRVVQTVADDGVDVVPETYVATHQRHQVVDFPYLTEVLVKFLLFSIISFAVV